MEDPFYLNEIVLPVIGCVGFIGNIASISHFSKCTSRRQHFQSYMMFLGIVDLFIIITSLIRYSGELYVIRYRNSVVDSYQDIINVSTDIESGVHIHDLKMQYLEKSKRFDFIDTTFNQLIFYLLPLFAMLKTGNIYLHLAISVERYNVVCRPFSAMRCKKYHAQLIITLIVLLAIIYNITTFFEHHLVYQVDMEDYATNVTGLEIEPIYIATICPTDLRQDKLYHYVMVVLALICMFLIPYLSVLVLNILIIKTLIANNEFTSVRNIPKKPNTVSRGLIECGLLVHHHVDKRRRNEVILAKLSLVIMIPYLLYHAVNIIPNIQELAKVSLSRTKTEYPQIYIDTIHFN